MTVILLKCSSGWQLDSPPDSWSGLGDIQSARRFRNHGLVISDSQDDRMSHVGIRGVVCEESLCKQSLLCVFNNSSPPAQNGHLFTYYIFRCIFMNEKFYILITISLKFVPKGSIHKNPALIQIMAWRRIGDKPLSEPMLIWFTGAYMRH